MALALAIGVLGSAVADARGLKTGFVDNPSFTSSDALLRDTWLDRAADARADIIRINVDWADIATFRPANPSDPARCRGRGSKLMA